MHARQGRGVFGIDMKVVGIGGTELPWDGESAGDLFVRGHWVAADYFGSKSAAPLSNGWFPTGDVAKIDADGFMQITDRCKDVIKSGGEWISSIDIENGAYSKPGSGLSVDELLAFFDGRVAKWWKPDAVIFVEAIPHSATGKVMKGQLRDQYRDLYSNHPLS